MSDRFLVALGVILILLNAACIVLNTVFFPANWPIALISGAAMLYLTYTTTQLVLQILEDR